MVVGTPDVYNFVKAANCEFVEMISDISGKISGIAVCANENLVLFSAERRGFIPQSAVFFIGQVFLFEDADNVVDGAVVVQSFFVEPDVVGDTVFFKIAF